MPKLSPQRWDEILSAFHTSRLSQRSFAKLYGLSLHTFRAKLYQSSRPSPVSPAPKTTSEDPFVRLEVSNPTSAPSSTPLAPSNARLRLTLGQARLDFAQLPDASWLISLLVPFAKEVR